MENHINNSGNKNNNFYALAHQILKEKCLHFLNIEYFETAQIILSILLNQKNLSALEEPVALCDAIIFLTAEFNFMFQKERLYINSAPVFQISESEFIEKLNIKMNSIIPIIEEIRNILDFSPLNLNWYIKSLNPGKVAIEALVFENGYLIDCREAAPRLQDQLFEQGIIPQKYYLTPLSSSENAKLDLIKLKLYE